MKVLLIGLTLTLCGVALEHYRARIVDRLAGLNGVGDVTMKFACGCSVTWKNVVNGTAHGISTTLHCERHIDEWQRSTNGAHYVVEHDGTPEAPR